MIPTSNHHHFQNERKAHRLGSFAKHTTLSTDPCLGGQACGVQGASCSKRLTPKLVFAPLPGVLSSPGWRIPRYQHGILSLPVGCSFLCRSESGDRKTCVWKCPHFYKERKEKQMAHWEWKEGYTKVNFSWYSHKSNYKQLTWVESLKSALKSVEAFLK